MESEQEVTRPPEDRTHIRELVAIGVIASVLGVALGLLIDWWPTQGSEEAEKIDTLYDILIIVSVPIFVMVMVIVLYSVWRFRMKPGEEELDGPPIHGNTRLEIIWTAIPAIILVALCSYSYVVLTDIEKAEADALEVRVVGEQFTWTFFYKDEDGKEFGSPQLYVPQGQQVNFTVQSRDVIHDFWVPAFRLKIDAVRGIDTHVRITPKTIGQYPVVCAELCGLGHAVMRQTAHVVPPAEFDQWVQQRGEQAAAGGEGQEGGGGETGGGAAAPDGKTIFTDSGCGGCHALSDAGTTGGTGPNLDEVLADKDAAFIHESIVDPAAELAPGYSDLMPKMYGDQLTEPELDALVKYLDEVTG
jgi:cytochrome c oxidase subunit 2